MLLTSTRMRRHPLCASTVTVQCSTAVPASQAGPAPMVLLLLLLQRTQNIPFSGLLLCLGSLVGLLLGHHLIIGLPVAGLHHSLEHRAS